MNIKYHIEEINENNYFVYFTENDVNISYKFILNNFCGEMEFYDFPTKAYIYNNIEGFVFGKENPLKELTNEIERFIEQYMS